VDAAAGDVWVDSWLTIWYAPRATIRRIVTTDPHKFVLGIAWMGGALAFLDSQVTTATSEYSTSLPHLPRLGPLGVAFAAIIFGLISIISLYGLAALYKWASHILGGSATRAEVRAALAWAQVPGLYLAAVMIIATALGLYDPADASSLSPPSLIESLVGVWVFVISLKCLGEVNHFSGWRALGAIVLGSLATLAVLIGLVLTFWLAVWFLHPVA
jgi:hypothetical protein